METSWKLELGGGRGVLWEEMGGEQCPRQKEQQKLEERPLQVSPAFPYVQGPGPMPRAGPLGCGAAVFRGRPWRLDDPGTQVPTVLGAQGGLLLLAVSDLVLPSAAGPGFLGLGWPPACLRAAWLFSGWPPHLVSPCAHAEGRAGRSSAGTTSFTATGPGPRAVLEGCDACGCGHSPALGPAGPMPAAPSLPGPHSWTTGRGIFLHLRWLLAVCRTVSRPSDGPRRPRMPCSDSVSSPASSLCIPSQWLAHRLPWQVFSRAPTTCQALSWAQPWTKQTDPCLRGAHALGVGVPFRPGIPLLCLQLPFPPLQALLLLANHSHTSETGPKCPGGLRNSVRRAWDTSTSPRPWTPPTPNTNRNFGI